MALTLPIVGAYAFGIVLILLLGFFLVIPLKIVFRLVYNGLIGGIVLWLTWLLGTVLGMYLGGIVAHPERWGLDMVMACFLLSMATGGKQDIRMMTIWAVVFCTSILAYLYLPKNMHVLVASCIGGVIGMLWKENTTQSASTINEHSEAQD